MKNSQQSTIGLIVKNKKKYDLRHKSLDFHKNNSIARTGFYTRFAPSQHPSRRKNSFLFFFFAPKLSQESKMKKNSFLSMGVIKVNHSTTFETIKHSG